MMRIITGSTGTSHVTSADDGSFNQVVFGEESKVLEIGHQFEATIVNNNTIAIKDGDLLLQGRHARINTGVIDNVTILTGSADAYRNDLIVARYTLDTLNGTGYEDISLVVIRGTETQGTPEDPVYNTGNIRNGDALIDYPLYRVKIAGTAIQRVEKLFTTSGGFVETQEAMQQLKTEVKRVDTVTLSVNGWSNAIPYTQTVTLTRIKSTDSPIISMGVPSSQTSQGYNTMSKAYSCIDRVISNNGSLTFYCYSKKPMAEIKCLVKGV